MAQRKEVSGYSAQFPKLRPLFAIFNLGKVPPEKTMLAGEVWTKLEEFIVSYIGDPNNRSYPWVVTQARDRIEKVALTALDNPLALGRNKTLVLAAKEAVEGNSLAADEILGREEGADAESIRATAHLVLALSTGMYDQDVHIDPSTLIPHNSRFGGGRVGSKKAATAAGHLRTGITHLAKAIVAK